MFQRGDAVRSQFGACRALLSGEVGQREKPRKDGKSSKAALAMANRSCPKEDVMKRTILKLTAALALVVTCGIATAYAQTNSNLRADVPFNFNVGKSTISAGECGVVIAGQVARIACANDQAGIVGQEARMDASGAPKLVFHKYGNQYFLAEVWTASRGLILTESPAEKEMRASSGDQRYTTLAILFHAIP
jgi:hypothetical protein